jgi:hypothetical protein
MSGRRRNHQTLLLVIDGEELNHKGTKDTKRFLSGMPWCSLWLCGYFLILATGSGSPIRAAHHCFAICDRITTLVRLPVLCDILFSLSNDDVVVRAMLGP